MLCDKGQVAEILSAANARLFRMSPARFAKFVEADVRAGSVLEAIGAAAFYFNSPKKFAQARARIGRLAHSLTTNDAAVHQPPR